MEHDTDMQDHDDRAWGTVAEVAEAYGVSADTIRRRMRKGELEARRETIPSGYRWLLPMPAPGETLPGHERTVTPVAPDLGPVITVLQEQLEARDREIARLLDLLESQGRALESALERPALPESLENEAPESPVSPETDATGINTHVNTGGGTPGLWARWWKQITGG